MRTIEEAIQFQIPVFPVTYIDEWKALLKLLRNSNESSVSKIRKIYTFADKVTAFVAPYTVCQKGCSHCCKIDVLVTAIEAQYIQKNVGISPDPGLVKSSGHTAAKRPCSFLDDSETCSIYENRPFACRTYFVMDDPLFCEDAVIEHVTYTSASNRFLQTLLEQIGFLNGNKPIRDIRDFFPNGRVSVSQQDFSGG